ncbi:unnamed protein product [Orchesella dallaii]|uniref:Uncharacterized protein n=1 Tax=Orchesella dallaii TaxID=48710 RepID=A0ABP1PL81_9HEXA
MGLNRGLKVAIYFLGLVTVGLSVKAKGSNRTSRQFELFSDEFFAKQLFGSSGSGGGGASSLPASRPVYSSSISDYFDPSSSYQYAGPFSSSQYTREYPPPKLSSSPGGGYYPGYTRYDDSSGLSGGYLSSMNSNSNPNPASLMPLDYLPGKPPSSSEYKPGKPLMSSDYKPGQLQLPHNFGNYPPDFSSSFAEAAAGTGGDGWSSGSGANPPSSAAGTATGTASSQYFMGWGWKPHENMSTPPPPPPTEAMYGWGPPAPPVYPPQAPNPPVPEFNHQFSLKPSAFGWETTYNVPCGNYKIQPRVLAHLRLATQAVLPKPSKSGDEYKRRRKRDSNSSPGLSENYYFDPFQQGRSLYSPPYHHHPQFSIPKPTFQPRTCRWNFEAVGECKLNFKCTWFQLPALFRCDENYLEVTDNTILLNNKFCGNRKPRQIYSSSTGKLTLTFKSEGAALPAIFDCTVLCSSDESPINDQKRPQTTPAPTESGSVEVFSSPASPPPTRLTSPQPVPIVVHIGSSSATAEVVSSNKGNTTLIINLPSKPQLRMGNCKCGVPDSQHSTKVVGRIVGGNAMKPGESPWTAAIVKKNSNRPFCGASLLNNLYLLTAAHCVLNQTRKTRDAWIPDLGNKTSPEIFFDVLLNEHDISQANEIAGGTIRAKVEKVIIHPKYNNVTFHFDAALIRLSKPVDFNPPEVAKSSRKHRYPYSSFDFHSLKRKKRFILPEIQARAIPPKPVPICLPEAEQGEKRNGKNVPLINDYAVVTGWGLMAEGGIPSNEMLKARVQIFNDSTCRDLYKKHNYVITETMMCAGYLNGNIDSCVGDSGSPLVTEDNERFVLTGLVSWGRGCGRKQLPGVYTKVSGD